MSHVDDVELHYLRRWRFLQPAELEADPVLVLSTDGGDYHCLVARQDVQRLAASFQRLADKIEKTS